LTNGQNQIYIRKIFLSRFFFATDCTLILCDQQLYTWVRDGYSLASVNFFCIFANAANKQTTTNQILTQKWFLRSEHKRFIIGVFNNGEWTYSAVAYLG
jgi:hypothetical protein